MRGLHNVRNQYLRVGTMLAIQRVVIKFVAKGAVDG